jgi:uncharacterized protein
MILPSTWLPAIWGGEEFMPDWRTLKEAEAFNKDVMAHYNHVMNALDHSECAPLFLEHEVDGKPCTVVDEWCEGFLLGMFLWGDEVDSVPDELLEPILFFTINLDSPEEALQIREEASAEEVDLLQELIPQSVFGLREHFGIGKRPSRPAPPKGNSRGGNKARRK